MDYRAVNKAKSLPNTLVSLIASKKIRAPYFYTPRNLFETLAVVPNFGLKGYLIPKWRSDANLSTPGDYYQIDRVKKTWVSSSSLFIM
jgi:hypothetical protein